MEVTLTAGQLHWSVHKVYNKLAALSVACYKRTLLSDNVAAWYPVTVLVKSGKKTKKSFCSFSWMVEKNEAQGSVFSGVNMSQDTETNLINKSKCPALTMIWPECESFQF